LDNCNTIVTTYCENLRYLQLNPTLPEAVTAAVLTLIKRQEFQKESPQSFTNVAITNIGAGRWVLEVNLDC